MLRSELVPISHNKCSTSTCERILDAIAKDNVKQDDYQSERDVVTKGIVSDIKHYNEQLKLVDEELEKLYFKILSKKYYEKIFLNSLIRFNNNRILVNFSDAEDLILKKM